MVRRAMLFGLLIGLLVLPSVAKADAIVFTFGTGTGHPGIGIVTIGPSAGGKISTTSPIPLTGAKHAPSGPSFTCPSGCLGSVTFSTGSFFSKVGSLLTYSPGGNISVTASGTGLGSIPAGAILFSGTFSGNTTFTITGPPSTMVATLAGPVKTTSLNPALLVLLNIPFQPGGQAVAFVIDIGLKIRGGKVTSGTITLVPEPGTLALFGTGLLGLAGLIRRRLR